MVDPDVSISWSFGTKRVWQCIESRLWPCFAWQDDWGLTNDVSEKNLKRSEETFPSATHSASRYISGIFTYRLRGIFCWKRKQKCQVIQIQWPFHPHFEVTIQKGKVTSHQQSWIFQRCITLLKKGQHHPFWRCHKKNGQVTPPHIEMSHMKKNHFKRNLIFFFQHFSGDILVFRLVKTSTCFPKCSESE